MSNDDKFYALEKLRAFINIRQKNEVCSTASSVEQLKEMGKRFELHGPIYTFIRNKEFEQLFQNSDFLTGLNWLKQIRAISSERQQQVIKQVLENLRRLFPETNIFNELAVN